MAPLTIVWTHHQGQTGNPIPDFLVLREIHTGSWIGKVQFPALRHPFPWKIDILAIRHTHRVITYGAVADLVFPSALKTTFLNELETKTQ